METDGEKSVSKLSKKKRIKSKAFVAEAMKEKSKITRPSSFRFSAPEVAWITSMLNKHGEDFIGIARDPKNLDQLTPNQIRHKIAKFKNTPDQWAQFLKQRGMLPKAEEKAATEEMVVE